MAAIFKWNWLLEPVGSRFMMFIYEMFGESGVRIVTGIIGTIIIILFIMDWIIKK
ncbi:Imm17 family immunity protein [Brachyspira suanatina]|uniref:Imm17 family immunity protein n=1 Tax=Brachyspira suanatina TaxID=381802 RepID=UPI000A6510CF|nr:Imm17 family immunity protein [Brachyspira suanatina]